MYVSLLGYEDQGLYRVVGVASKVTKLLTMGLDKRKADKFKWVYGRLYIGRNFHTRPILEKLAILPAFGFDH